ncbi:MAG: hypothetical protein JSU09_00855 [Bacteroidetes bacterium]|nr:hypothetical protein [Bacteroidota bacterium]
MNFAKILEQVGKFQIKSITDSLFKYGLYMSIVATISAIFKTAMWVTIFLFATSGLFIIVGLVFYIYFAKNKPDYLRTEDFQLRKQSIELLGDKDNQLNAQVTNIIDIMNPYRKELGSGNKTDFSN